MSTLTTEEAQLELERQRIELERQKLELEAKRLELKAKRARRAKSKSKGKGKGRIEGTAAKAEAGSKGTKGKTRKKRSGSQDGAKASRSGSKASRSGPKASRSGPKASRSDSKVSPSDSKASRSDSKAFRSDSKASRSDSKASRSEPEASGSRSANDDAPRPEACDPQARRPSAGRQQAAGRKPPVALIAAACLSGLAVGVGAFMATRSQDPSDALATQRPAEAAPSGASAKGGSSDSGRVTPAAMLERAKALSARNPDAAIRLLETVVAERDPKARAAAETLLGQLRHTKRQQEIARKTAEGEIAQAEWEGKADERAEQEAQRAKVAAQARLLDRVRAVGAQAPQATTAASLKAGEQTLAVALADPSCDDAIRAAADDARATLETQRNALRADVTASADAKAETGDYPSALKLLDELTALDGGRASSEVVQRRSSWALAQEAKLAEAKAAAERARQEAEAQAAAAAEEKAKASTALAFRTERIVKDVTKRATQWFKLRSAKAMQCKDCKGKLIVRCGPCKGSEHIQCLQCQGSGAIITFGVARGLTSAGGRGRRVKQTCPRCRGERYEDCPKCTDGTNVCDCKQEHRGAIAGFRELAGKRAFWDFVSSATKSGRKRQEFFPEVGRGNVLAKQIGPSIAIHSARIESVTVKADHVLVKARVEWAKGGGTSTFTSTWIAEDGKFFVRSSRDTKPERLLD